MALQATMPLVIMGAALTVAGTFTGGVYKKRQITEHSLAYETGLRQVGGIVPPRTHIAPFLAKPNPAIQSLDAPLGLSGAPLSQIVPGGHLDPYAAWERAEKEGKTKDFRMYTYKPYDQMATAESSDWITRAFERLGSKLEKEPKFVNERPYAAVHRADPMAEVLRIAVYAHLHPELELDMEKIEKAGISFKGLQHWH